MTLTWASPDLNEGKSTLVQVMARCRQATSHYLNQCWHGSLPPYGVIRPHWVNLNDISTFCCSMNYSWRFAIGFPSLFKRLMHLFITSYIPTLISILISKPAEYISQYFIKTISWFHGNFKCIEYFFECIKKIHWNLHQIVLPLFAIVVFVWSVSFHTNVYLGANDIFN